MFKPAFQQWKAIRSGSRVKPEKTMQPDHIDILVPNNTGGQHAVQS